MENKVTAIALIALQWYNQRDDLFDAAQNVRITGENYGFDT